MIITIDGPAGAGKGTLARALAAHYHLAYLDTGKLYRGVAALALDRNIDPADHEALALCARALRLEDLERPDLRAPAVSSMASQVAAVAAVRAALLDFQKNFARLEAAAYKGAILDGRDTGTVICPDADIKFFIDPSAEVRAARRCAQYRKSGEAPAAYDVILAEIKERDLRDRGRAEAPLVPAEDAVIIDNGAQSPDETLRDLIAIIDGRLRPPSSS